jgi:hypothetical protein
VETTENILNTGKKISFGRTPRAGMKQKEEIIDEGKHFRKVRNREGP